MERHSRSNHQVCFADVLQSMRSFDLYPEQFRPIFTNSDNIAYKGVVTMKLMPTRDYHLQSNGRILSVFTKLGEVTKSQRWDPGYIDVTSAYGELQNQRILVCNIRIKQATYNGDISR
jgi:hypothetical protein